MMMAGVTAHFCAAHQLPGDALGQGEIHGHSYEVTAWFEMSGDRDVRVFQAALRAMLALWDHKILPAELQWCEHIARAVGTLASCVEVEVRRPLEGLHGRWKLDPPPPGAPNDP